MFYSVNSDFQTFWACPTVRDIFYIGTQHTHTHTYNYKTTDPLTNSYLYCMRSILIFSTLPLSKKYIVLMIHSWVLCNLKHSE